MGWTADFTRTADQTCWTADGFDGCDLPPGSTTPYAYLGGTAVAQDGRAVTVYLDIEEPLPNGVHYIGGFAHDGQGRRYVTLDPNPHTYIGGLAIREDGVQVIAPDELPVGAISGIPVTQDGETAVSENTPTRFANGFGFDAQGRLTVTDKGP